ncbi:MAG: helix-turn-helix domain-containing protein [Pseudomonadales bacterium]
MPNSKPQESVSPLARTASSGAPSFGSLLRQWRNHRRLSQLSLAVDSGISQRHISFLETGRAQPSRRTVLDLSETLGIPLRERNTLLLRAGFSSVYSDAPLPHAESGLFREALDQILARHEPYPALIVDGSWNLLTSNAGAMRLFSEFVDLESLLALTGDNAPDFPMVRLCMEDDGLKPFIENWDEVAYSFLQRARAALLANPLDSAAKQLVDYLEQHPSAPAAWHAPIWNEPTAPALGIRLRKGAQRFSLFSMMAHFGAPQQITAQELSVELFFPADQTTEQALTMLAQRDQAK